MKVLVTGAAGFIGSHVSKKLLEAGASVIGIDNLNDYYDVNLKKARLDFLRPFDRFTFEKIDISDKEAVFSCFKQNPDITHVIHLAAQAGVRYSLENPYAYIDTNVMGHVVLLEAARTLKDLKHFLYASSSSVYGGNKKTPFSVEDNINNPISVYAASKNCCEMLSNSYAYLYKMPLTGLRFFTVYGPWGRPDMAAYIFADAVCHNKEIPVFNHGDMRRDFTYIDDIVSGVIGVLEHPTHKNENGISHKVYNLGNHKSEKLLDFVEIIQKELGKKADIKFYPMQAGDVKETFADIKESRKDFGFEPKTNIQTGLKNFIAWYKDYHNIT